MIATKSTTWYKQENRRHVTPTVLSDQSDMEGIIMAKRTVAERFEEKYIVDEKTGCWLWQAGKDRFGYGKLKKGGKTLKSHRVAYELYKGPIPNGEGYHGTCVCHTCDNPSCCNPDHLFLGTPKDNAADMAAKGRSHHPIGTKNKNAVLTDKEVKVIKKILKRFPPKPGRGPTECICIFLGDWFGVSPSAITDIHTGRTWSHI